LRLPRPDDLCWLDGRPLVVGQAAIGIDDPALAGRGLFETLALREGGVLDLERHLARLQRGAERLGLVAPAAATLGAAALAAAGNGAPACGWIKIVVTGGGHSIVYRGAMEPAEEGREARAIVLPWRRDPRDPLVGLKTLGYEANRLGQELAARRSADEGLWLNTRGHLTEGCTSNLFVVSGRMLWTADERQGLLPGVVRAVVLAVAAEADLIVRQGKLRVLRLLRADEAFLTSSLCGLRPLVALDGRPIGAGRGGALTARLAGLVARERHSRAART
jgi:branched-chain amino acid aminotransferase